MNRKRLFAVLGAAVFVAAAVILLLLPRTPGPTYANFSRLSAGMSCEEVEAVLGADHRADYRDGTLTCFDYETSERDRIRIDFEPDGRVRECLWNGMEDGRGRWEKMRDRFPWIAKPSSRQFPMHRL